MTLPHLGYPFTWNLSRITIDKDKAHLVIVTTGIQDERYIQILSGIDSGMAVIQGPFDALSRKLEEGKSVEIKPDSEDSKED